MAYQHCQICVIGNTILWYINTVCQGQVIRDSITWSRLAMSSCKNYIPLNVVSITWYTNTRETKSHNNNNNNNNNIYYNKYVHIYIYNVKG